MLGRFLELSIPTSDIQGSLNFYDQLGFSQAQVGEAWKHPYAVVTDGRISIGLHQSSDFYTSLTFVKPDLFKHLRHLEEMDVHFEFRRLGNDVFNEVGWLDPSGHLIRLVEARTFSPSKRKSNERPVCGYFIEVALPAAESDTTKDYWERLGFVGLDQKDGVVPHVSCTSDTIDIGLYGPNYVREPTLRYEVDDVEATLGVLAALGMSANSKIAPAIKAIPAAVVNSPDGTPILLVANHER